MGYRHGERRPHLLGIESIMVNNEMQAMVNQGLENTEILKRMALFAKDAGIKISSTGLLSRLKKIRSN